MSPNLIWSIVLSVIGIVGILLAGRKSRYGWALGFGAQILWIIFALTSRQYGFILSALGYGSVYAHNYIRWTRDKNKDIAKEANTND